MISSVGEILENGRWALTFTRSLHVWENQQLESLLLRLQNVYLDPSKPDSFKWKWTADRGFTVRLVYRQGELQNLVKELNVGVFAEELESSKGGIFCMDGYLGTRGNQVCLTTW
ncbi:hypothetical protein RHMOL_Rhmol01G0298200 [Rhododendron molle]|uniref:Uncharacterized protein n=1 Tax=Rhododendron molle TaxID=49168 RepID=A0ACC0Q8N6_RHOML|nr:hypothetical protein RHMOL_Rhmol01G0298200 [Rhododendron molle]